ncbi:MAG TPA: DMT family transporter, partial [Acidimicrobiales bacterium]|nr:DMT family transporter [Acidimicrobiales bacterium]
PYLLIRIAVRELTPATLVFARTAPAALLLLPLAVRRGQLRPLLARWPAVVAYTGVELAIPWLLLSRAEQHLSSSLAALLVATVPLIGAVLAWATRDADRLDARRVAGLVAGFGGVVALVGIDVGGAGRLAVGEVLLVAVGYATGPFIISRRLTGLPALGVVTASLAITAIAYAPVALTHPPHHLSAEVAGSVAVLALVCTALAFVLFFALIAEAGPARATVITYLNPAVALVLGIGLLGEPFTAGIAVGFPLVLAGSVLATGGVRPRDARTLAGP